MAGEREQGGGQEQQSWKRRAAFWMAAFLPLFGLWALFTSNLFWQEMVIGVPAAAIAATAFEATREQPVAHFRPKMKWLAQAAFLPWLVLTGTYEIFKVMALDLLRIKPAESLVRAVPFEAGGDNAGAAARRALATAYTTVPPNFIIISVDLAGDELVFHQISPEPPPRMTINLGAR